MWFRRRRVDLGTYVDPPPTQPVPVERIVRDGTLIGESVVRMSLRNRIIVGVLRDRSDLDPAALAQSAADELRDLAEREGASAERMRQRREQRRADPGYEGLDLERLQASLRRERVYRGLSTAFSARADDAEAVAALVERSRVEAWDELSPVLLDRAAGARRDPDYERQKPARLAALADDLAGLAD